MKKFYIFVLFPFILSAQSEFFNDASLGLKADYIFTINKDFYGRGGGLGFSFSNVVDVGLEYNRISYQSKYNITYDNSFVYGAYNFRSGINCLKIFLGYAYNSANTKPLNLSLLQLTGPVVGVNISPKIYESNSIKLIPSLSFSMAFLSSAYKVDDGSNHNISIGITLNTVSKVSNRLGFYLSPGISKSLTRTKESLIYNLSAGLLFNFAKN